MAQRRDNRGGAPSDEVRREHYRDDWEREERRRFNRPAWGRGYEGWRRGRISGGFGSQFDAWSSGAGYQPGRLHEGDWQPTRPARGRSAWAGDWEDADYRGRGPRGYRRSDDRLKEEVCEALTDDWGVDAHDITVTVADGEVTLTGTVASRDQKRRAGDCVERVSGVRDVFNQLRITPHTSEGGEARAGGR